MEGTVREGEGVASSFDAGLWLSPYRKIAHYLRKCIPIMLTVIIGLI